MRRLKETLSLYEARGEEASDVLRAAADKAAEIERDLNEFVSTVTLEYTGEGGWHAYLYVGRD